MRKENTIEIIEEDGIQEKELLIGKKILMYGYSFTIGKVYFAEFFKKDGWHIEFVDSYGQYHNWKQWEDNGIIVD